MLTTLRRQISEVGRAKCVCVRVSMSMRYTQTHLRLRTSQEAILNQHRHSMLSTFSFRFFLLSITNNNFRFRIILFPYLFSVFVPLRHEEPFPPNNRNEYIYKHIHRDKNELWKSNQYRITSSMCTMCSAWQSWRNLDENPLSKKKSSHIPKTLHHGLSTISDRLLPFANFVSFNDAQIIWLLLQAYFSIYGNENALSYSIMLFEVERKKMPCDFRALKDKKKRSGRANVPPDTLFPRCTRYTQRAQVRLLSCAVAYIKCSYKC